MTSQHLQIPGETAADQPTLRWMLPQDFRLEVSVRSPNKEELRDLRLYLLSLLHADEAEFEGIVRNPSLVNAEEMETGDMILRGCAIAVFPDYQTDGPGYAGKIMVVTYPSGPESTQTFVWHKEKFCLVTEQE